MPGGWGPGAWTPSGGQEPFTAGSSSSSGSGSGSGSGGGWTQGVGRDESGYLPTHDLYSGDGTGVNGIDQVTTQDVTPQKTEQEIQDDNVWALAELEASNKKYELSYEGKLMKSSGYNPGDKEWTAKFGLGHIVATNKGEWEKNEQGEWKFIAPEGIRSTGQWDEYGNQIAAPGKYLYSGAGKFLLDKGDITTAEGYEVAKDKYWTETRPEEDLLAGQGENNYGYGYDYSPGSYTVSGGYGGYGGDPNELGKTPFYGDPYSEARYAPLDWHKRMVNVNSPLYAARGGIMSLRR
jgi:hypothetical protein